VDVDYKRGQFEKAAMIEIRVRNPGYLDACRGSITLRPWHTGSGDGRVCAAFESFAGFLGTNAAFLPAPGLKKIREDADIFDLRQFVEKRFSRVSLRRDRAFPKQFPYTDDAPITHPATCHDADDVILKVYVTAPLALSGERRGYIFVRPVFQSLAGARDEASHIRDGKADAVQIAFGRNPAAIAGILTRTIQRAACVVRFTRAIAVS